MNKRSVVVIGLPSSGKTTFLAALWHLVTAKDVDTVLKFSSLPRGDVSHLNGIARRWREAKVQDRTAVSGHKLVTIKLESETDTIEVTFPDVPGESYRDMWENRFCDPEIAEILLNGNVILFIHADTIREPRWVVDEAELSRQLGLALAEGEVATWHPRLAPTQVQALDLLQLLRRPPLDIGSRRLVIMLSAWDKAKDEGLQPNEYVQAKLPLLWQYLDSAADGWNFQIFGVSAQGGDYDPNKLDVPPSAEADALRDLDCASLRIKLIGKNTESHDLTEPLKWLMG